MPLGSGLSSGEEPQRRRDSRIASRSRVLMSGDDMRETGNFKTTGLASASPRGRAGRVGQLLCCSVWAGVRAELLSRAFIGVGGGFLVPAWPPVWASASSRRRLQSKSPTNADAHLLPETIVIMKLAMLQAVLVDQTGYLYVIATILGYFEHLSFLVPINGLQSFGGFLDAKSCCSDGIKRKPVLKGVVQFDQHIERGELPQVKSCIAVKDFVIESQMVETNHQIGPLQIFNELIHLFFSVNFVSASRRAIRDPHAHAHAADLVPSTDFLSGLLRFQVEINKIFHRQAGITRKVYRVAAAR